MKLKSALRSVSFIMLIIAVVFVAFALTHPELGTAFYIGDLLIGAEIWRVFYAFYAVVMAVLFISSFFVKRKNS